MPIKKFFELTLLVIIFISSISNSVNRVLQVTVARTYNLTLDCLRKGKYLNDRNTSQWIFPHDAQEHFDEIMNATKAYRNIPYHAGPRKFRGPWIENHFIETFMNKELNYFNGFIPLFIQWTDIFVNKWTSKLKTIPNYDDMIQHLITILRDDVIYITVNQNDQGLLPVMTFAKPNILVFSAGGFGHIPIPLIKGEIHSIHPSQSTFEYDFGKLF